MQKYSKPEGSLNLVPIMLASRSILFGYYIVGKRIFAQICETWDAIADRPPDFRRFVIHFNAKSHSNIPYVVFGWRSPPRSPLGSLRRSPRSLPLVGFAPAFHALDSHAS